LAIGATRAGSGVATTRGRREDVGGQKFVESVNDVRDTQLLDVIDGRNEVPPEIAQHLLPINLAIRNSVELLLKIGSESILNIMSEETFEDSGYDPSLVFGDQALLVEPHIATVAERRKNRYIGRRPANAELLKLLDKTSMAEGIKVFIGSENPFFEIQGCSLVVGNYQAGNVVGTLGVIGPVRMQYKQVIQVVDYTSRLLSRILGERLQRGIER